MIYKFAFLDPIKQFEAKMRTTSKTKYQIKLQRHAKYKRRKMRRRQHGRFLNRCDFAYPGRDMVNQVIKSLDKLAPKLINQTSKEIGEIAEARIKQAINDGRQQIQKIIYVHKTPFRLLGNLRKQKFS